MKVLVLGSTGMLGHQMCRSLANQDIQYDDTNSRSLSVENFLSNPDSHLDFLFRFDYIINCIGQIKPRFSGENGILNGYKINSIFPRVMADICDSSDTRFIHITTDCVFSGKDGKYTEDSPHDAVDDYGLSKSLGEPKNCTVIRTSIIGPEVANLYSLVEWAKSQAGKQVKGFTNHIWNGLTTKELARVIIDLMKSGKTWRGVRHVHAHNDITKDKLLKSLSDNMGLRLDISPVEASDSCDRTLRSNYSYTSRAEIPIIEQMVEEMCNA